MRIPSYNIQTGEWTEIEVPDPEPIPDPPRWPVADRAYQAGEVFGLDGEYYTATQVICRGEKVRPGENCTETTMADVINMLKEQEGE